MLEQIMVGNQWKERENWEQAGEGEEVILQGSIYHIRRMGKKWAFILLRMRRKIIQCVYSPEFSRFSLQELKEESCIWTKARVSKQPGTENGMEYQLLEVKVLSMPECQSPVALYRRELQTSLEYLLDARPLTLRNARQRAIFKLQEGICRAVRTFLQERDFTEIHTPKLVFAGAEGGANLFSVKYFNRMAYLAQSPQFYKQMMVGVYERVYEIGPVFRAEPHDTSRHLNEYTGIDLEMGYITELEQLMRLETEMLSSIFEFLRQEYTLEINLLQAEVPCIQSIPVLPFCEAKRLLAKELGIPGRISEDLQPQEEKALCRWAEMEYNSPFLFITRYPSAKRPFYTSEDTQHPGETQGFDLLFRGMEITTGGLRIHNYQEQVRKMKQRGMEVADFESYLQAHRHGLPPHGGLGIGLERLTARLLKLENVRQAALFPRDMHRLEP